jgi:hypothetical protein
LETISVRMDGESQVARRRGLGADALGDWSVRAAPSAACVWAQAVAIAPSRSRRTRGGHQHGSETLIHIERTLARWRCQPGFEVIPRAGRRQVQAEAHRQERRQQPPPPAGSGGPTCWPAWGPRTSAALADGTGAAPNRDPAAPYSGSGRAAPSASRYRLCSSRSFRPSRRLTWSSKKAPMPQGPRPSAVAAR